MQARGPDVKRAEIATSIIERDRTLAVHLVASAFKPTKFVDWRDELDGRLPDP